MNTTLHILEKRYFFYFIEGSRRDSKVLGKDGRRVLKVKCTLKIYFIKVYQKCTKRGNFSLLQKKTLNGVIVPPGVSGGAR